jgi:hypothetical protein
MLGTVLRPEGALNPSYLRAIQPGVKPYPLMAPWPKTRPFPHPDSREMSKLQSPEAASQLMRPTKLAHTVNSSDGSTGLAT